MAPQPAPRFAHVALPTGDPRFRGVPDGAWWPESRQLADQLQHLFDAWPTEQSRIHRILFSPTDWDDRPRKVRVDTHWVKTGHFPNDDTHTITLALSDRTRRTIAVIDPATEPDEAAKILARVGQPAS